MKTTEMKLVPVTPTEEMLKAGGFESESCWANMIAAAPKREWQGLTDEEREELWNTFDVTSDDYVRAIEALLKEKNFRGGTL